MCGRYFFDAKTALEVEDELELDSGLLSVSSGDVTPAMSPAVITSGRGSDGVSLKVSDMFWGVTGNDKKLVINARAESALEKPMFSDSVERRRLVIPASGFYEWDKDKNKVTFYKKDKSPIYLAGFYKLSDNKDSFVILTTAANESMIRVHDRMPLMIEKNAVKDWLFDTYAAKEMLGMKMPLLESHQEYEQMKLF